MPTTPLTHTDLVRHAERWLREDCQCVLVLTEATKGARHEGEKPDAIGWKRDGISIVCESKVSLEDLRRDSHKDHRQYGMGSLRWIVAERYAFEPFQVPEGWGLLEYDSETGQMVQTRKAPAWHFTCVNDEAEKLLLIKAVYDSKRGGGDAEAGRRSNQGHIPAKYHDLISGYLSTLQPGEGVYASEVVHMVLASHMPRHTTGKLCKWLANDARQGLIPGVRAEGQRAMLYPTQED